MLVERSAVRGLVLAGGESTRFGRDDKALALLDGRPLLDHVLEPVTAATTGPPILAVADQVRGDRLCAGLDGPITTVTDAPAYAGPLAGLLAGAERTGRPWLFVCACDMPRISVCGIDAVRAFAGPEVDAVVPVVDGSPQPLHALYRTGRVTAACEGLSRSASLRSLVDRLERVAFPEADDVDAPLAQAVTNVNTRRDLRKARADS